MFENKKTKVQEVHYSRYIASWHNVGGKWYDASFEDWLAIQKLDEQEIRDVVSMAINGKLELENSAKAFLTSLENLSK